MADTKKINYTAASINERLAKVPTIEGKVQEQEQEGKLSELESKVCKLFENYSVNGRNAYLAVA